MLGYDNMPLTLPALHTQTHILQRTNDLILDSLPFDD